MNKKDIYAGLLALSSLASAPAFAASIVNFTFDDGSRDANNIPVFVNGHDIAANAGITNVSTWSDRDGAFLNTVITGPLATDVTQGGLVGNPNTGRSVAARSFGTGGTAGNEFRFSFTVLGSLSLSDFSFWEQGSNGPNGNGPSAWTLFINDTNVASGAATRGNPGGDHNGLLSLSGLTGNVNVRIFASGAANDATATWRIDNFILNGAVAPVPLPASLPMLVGALGLLGVARRRRG